MSPHSRSLWLLLVAALVGCAARGARFDPDSVPRIQPEATTQAEVRRWFGAPTTQEMRGTGTSKWVYFYEERSRRDTRSVTKVGRFLASIFGWRVFFPPVDVAYENTVRHRLAVYFDEEGVVRDYAYERTEIPSKVVY